MSYDTSKLKFFDNVSDVMANDSNFPSVLLTSGYGYGISAELTPEGNVKLNTKSGGGHGDPSVEDSGRQIEEWLDLLGEVKIVSEHYWGK